MILLRPIAWLYAAAMQVRNALFDCGLLASRSYPLPVVGVGNLAVGGTGKTPHTEYLVRLLRDRLHVAVLSRGYGRRTKGFRLADDGTTAAGIGDEPAQIHRKFPDVTVCVDERRCHGIDRLRGLLREPFCVLLDDAFQHRHVRPGLQILLTDYSRPYTRDHVMPEGRLRERAAGARRADIIVVTKCPPDLARDEAESLRHELCPTERQRVFFSCMAYGAPRPVFPEAPAEMPRTPEMLVVTGIARPAPLLRHLGKGGARLRHMAFADHHSFGRADIDRINAYFDTAPDTQPVGLTTEKDAERLRGAAQLLSPAAHHGLYAVPIEVRFLFGGAADFDRTILDFCTPQKP